ncbi:MAG: hypothetical protein LEGION0398_MBIBDBAK_00707 [Legionellaceae bacterium]
MNNNNQLITQKDMEKSKNKIYYLIAKCHELLGDGSSAMSFYLHFQDKKQRYFSEAVIARKNLIKNHLDKILKPANTPIKTEQESINQSLFGEFNQEGNLVLPNNIILPSQLEKHWKKEAEWFYSVNENKINNEFKKRDEQLDKLISAKKIEKEVIKEIGTNEKLIETETALTQFQEAKENLSTKNQKLSCSYRKKYRRHAAERHFFNPIRSKKPENLKKLTGNIIEQRFNQLLESIEPVNLQGKSSRLVITAERVFQEAVIDLLPNHRMSCIPIMREQQWSNYNGSNKYGPIEKYKVDNTEIHAEHRTDPKPQRLGDSFLPQHGTYIVI